MFLTRQPIFDRHQTVYGYELSFRPGPGNFFDHPDADQAAARVVIQSFLSLGIETVTGKKKAFINIPKEFLLREYIHLFPRQMIVAEIQENADLSLDVISACKKLKKAGYPVVLDHFVDSDRMKPLVDLADIIKVDFLATHDAEKRALADRFREREIQLLAEGIETRAAFHLAQEYEYTYFQGSFFSKPVLVRGKEIPGVKLHYLKMVQEIHKPNLDLNQIEQVIKQDVSLSYKLLRYINSAFFEWRNEIRSIKHALALMGEKDVKKWASLVALASMGEDKPSEITISAILRAKFCEALAFKSGMGDQSQEIFLMGMLSLLGALLDRPLREVLKDIPLSREVKDALMGEASRFRPVLESVIAYERADWDRFSYWVKNLSIPESEIPELYLQAVHWADKSMPAFAAA